LLFREFLHDLRIENFLDFYNAFKNLLTKKTVNLIIIPVSQRTAIINNKTPTQKMPTAFFARALDSRQQTADSRQQTADSRQQTADSIIIHIF
jgi:hypothetical protein